MLKIIITNFLSLLFFVVEAQKVEVQGKISDAKSNIPLSGVSVSIEGIGTVTNSNGFFSLKIEKTIAENKVVIITHLGYQKRELAFQSGKFYIVDLEIASSTLSEVVVSSGAEKIIKKAIERIPDNYPTNDFLLNGILRIYHTETDSPKIYRFFKSDAVLQLHYPSYNQPETDVEVKVIQNKPIFLHPDPINYDTTLWKGGYLIDDFVHKKSLFLDNDEFSNYKYTISGKTFLQGSKVWIINFESKHKKYASGTVFIDTASYAFVAANYSRFNIKKFRHRTIDESHQDILFQKVNNKWYLYKKKILTNYRSHDGKHSASKDFIVTGITDTLDVPSLKRNEIIKEVDEDYKIIKITTDSNWVFYDSLFNKAEREHAIAYIPLPTMDKNTNTTIKQSQSYDEDEIPFYKRSDYLEHTRLRLQISTDYINVRSSSSARGNLGIGFGTGIRITASTYIHLMSAINFKDANKISTTKTGIFILHSINVSKQEHPFYITPLAGINLVELTTRKENFKKLLDVVVGLGFSCPVKPKLRPFLNISYNKTVKEFGSLQTYHSTPFSFSAGTFFIF